jgi:hypothetical protein
MRRWQQARRWCAGSRARGTRERGLHRDFEQFRSLDPADHDDPVLPQKGRRLMAPLSPISSHLHLVDAVQVVLDGSSAVLMLWPGLLSSESAE